ncbi:hypothetical protein O9G_001304 [Rozella allomycis CSF55]|uniref:Uncharacterized protein n=1 Tax=Rozella allomycis (strain CSF55) TaxID=988480 RepID=A0A075AUK3_ROZAC|nr:hypothetical protein O9G_001304 [Rozella allomycis CSF55]|eukprot:EPZ32402.1 hypothetical protein O9G_001304 [Rozella allomycis CSF55]
MLSVMTVPFFSNTSCSLKERQSKHNQVVPAVDEEQAFRKTTNASTKSEKSEAKPSTSANKPCVSQSKPMRDFDY